eukprot:TRINITY_DN5538_c0_g1_i1.p1 TRINITY_DN5538_c0_g1~~TRINITY_DN5538_c0_g1_i1.p1  ORF type:complete len:521 (+),score=149.97 TRINITY_DN5538_c0_g1_i1:76-1563(+)
MPPAIIIEKLLAHEAAKTAIIDRDGKAYKYGEMVEKARGVAGCLEAGNRVLVLTEGGAGYVSATLGAWWGGLCTVPLCGSHTVREMVYYIKDCEGKYLLHDDAFAERAKALQEAVPALILIDVSDTGSSHTPVPTPVPQASDSPSTIIYTSGTTGNPKGAVHTHSSLASMASSLAEAWAWSPSDIVVNCLPLHHIHGFINMLYCSLFVGATCRFSEAQAPKLHPSLARGDGTLFMAVPTVYAKLMAYHKELDSEAQQAWKATVSKKYRLMVSGSAALPPPMHRDWKATSGLDMLERYGMTETGMNLSQPLLGERTVGAVGAPLPGVEVKVEPDTEAPLQGYDIVGRLLVKSSHLFAEYYNKPDATKEAFTDGWFHTGDCVGVAQGTYSILGRSSVDIIKSSGYKLSALEIEAVLLESPDVCEAAVLGVPDDTYGEVVGAIIAPADPAHPPANLRDYCLQSLAPYKAPRLFKFLDALPRNAMGKVNKKELVKLFTE